MTSALHFPPALSHTECCAPRAMAAKINASMSGHMRAFLTASARKRSISDFVSSTGRCGNAQTRARFSKAARYPMSSFREGKMSNNCGMHSSGVAGNRVAKGYGDEDLGVNISGPRGIW